MLKQARHEILARSNAFRAHVVSLEDMPALTRIAAEERPDVIVHLAAQAGVRYSLENPRAYVDSNLVGTFNVMEIARVHEVRHFLYASTSSIYGANRDMPFVETQRTDHPLTLYAATKKAGEDMIHSYAHLWKIPTTAFRFFTVYGPWGRPDMALFKFVRAALEGQPIEIYGQGAMSRDFTYVDDLVECIVRLVGRVPVEGAPVGPEDSLSPAAPYRVVNIAGGQPIGLLAFVDAIEAAVGRPVIRTFVDMQKGDVPATAADPRLLSRLTGFRPQTPVETGVRAFVDWYRGHYGA